ncbi:FkbM family methyltransferase [Defluviimonas sp. D31]|uniref:FkbM family methyltransferase n=1 Tax=Defluviimonas sp. D31 TaxID=3083253 RepID=UPI00296F345F|nr:FkbM family methyltransferase [Defluviimonas sp. D31]MDW4549324.1 FkbM family methyltransferase [Defluviimonas sp. D31]
MTFFDGERPNRTQTHEQYSLIEVNTRFGRFCIQDRPDIIGDSLREYGEWAQAELDILFHFMAYGETVIDGGACFGTHARAFSEKVGSRGRVICFEPSAENRTVLARNIAMAPLQNIEVRACGLADVGGRGRLLETQDGNVGGTRLAADAGDGPVELIRLEDEIDEVVHFIKLDLEGGELQALKGATRILADHRPVVFSEVLNVGSGVDLLRHMQGCGYFCYGINTPAYNPANFNGSTHDVFAGGTECGLLFLPTESAARFSERVDTLALPLIEMPDDLVLLLLQQPQYSRETLRRQMAARRLRVPPAPCDVERAEAEAAESREAAKRAEVEAAESRAAADRAEVEAAESREAAKRAEVEAAESREATKRAVVEAVKRSEAEAAESRAARDRAESGFARRLDLAQAQLDELRKLHEQLGVQHAAALRLANRARKFPFSLYFWLNTRHRRATRALLRSADMPNLVRARMTQLENILAAPSPKPEPNPVARTSNKHVELLRAISPRIGQPILAPLPEILEPVLETEAIAAVLANGSNNVVVSLSHDNYLKVTGGTQICIQIEAARAATAGMAYLNIHPVRTCTALLPESETDMAVFRLTLDGSVIGVARYADIMAAVESLTVLGKSFRFVVHHLLGHAPEAVARLIEAGGDSRCCFWLHDFFAACQSYTLMRNTISYCGAPDVGSPACGICVFGASRAAHMQRLSEFFDRIAVTALAPSQVAADFWTKACDYRLHDVVVQPHITLDAVARPKPLPSLGRADAAPIRVAFVGAPVAHKGWLEFERLVADHSASTEIEFHYFGRHDVKLDIAKHHVVASSEAPDAMTRALTASGIDFVLHFAAWPETFSLTAAEALASHAFVVTDVRSGNVAALVQATGRGVVMDSADAVSDWLNSSECRDLALRVREQRRAETLHARYSDMAIPTLQRMTEA